MLKNTWQTIVTRVQSTECSNNSLLLPALRVYQRLCEEQEAYQAR